MDQPIAQPAQAVDELAGLLDGPHVVAVGGGHGLACVLKAALRYASRVDAVVTVADDGGSSGRLAPHLDIPPPGDIRQCLVALTPDGSPWKDVFEYRFEDADVAGHSLGNLILAGLADIEGSFEGALMRAERILHTSGSVIPASDLHLELEIESEGRTIAGQVEVSLHHGRVDSIRVLPSSCVANERAVEAIMAADQIILGPGSLMTSTIAAMCVPGITEAINRSDARLVYVANIVTQDGETLGLDGVDHLETLLRLTGVRPPHTIVANSTRVDVVPPLEAVDFDPELAATYGADLLVADLVDEMAARPSHDSGKLGAALSTTHA